MKPMITFEAHQYSEISEIFEKARDAIFAHQLHEAIDFVNWHNEKQDKKRFFKKEKLSMPTDGKTLYLWVEQNMKVWETNSYWLDFMKIGKNELHIIINFLRIVNKSPLPCSYAISCEDYNEILDWLD